MKIQQVYAVFFSPTHGTKQYIEAIAERLSLGFETIDLTKPEVRRREYHFSDHDLVLFGAPVYSGRLPVIEDGIFDRIHGDHTPAVFNVSYGNREFEDALLEEKELCEANGFVGIAAAAWIAPHTFSARIAANRPDSDDYRRIDLFAAKILELLKNGISGAEPLQVPGNHPYRDVNSMPVHPETGAGCEGCGQCAAVCPTGAVSPEAPGKTDPGKCINCFACVKACPQHTRGIDHPIFHGLVQKLEGALVDRRKEPEIFF